MTTQKTAAANARLQAVWNKLTIRQLKAAVSHWGGASFAGDYGRMNKEQLIEWLASQDAKRLADIRANELSGLNSSLGLTYDGNRAKMAAELVDHLAPINEVEDSLDPAIAKLHSTITRVFHGNTGYQYDLVVLSNS